MWVARKSNESVQMAGSVMVLLFYPGETEPAVPEWVGRRTAAGQAEYPPPVWASNPLWGRRQESAREVAAPQPTEFT